MESIDIDGHQVLIDSEDVLTMSQYKWRYLKCGYIHTSWRKNGKIHGVYLHRLLMNAKPGEIVDHINHDPMDNRKANLRIATQSQNQMNRKRNALNQSGYKGVIKGGNRWYGRITKEGKSYSLGGYATPFEAHEAYRKKAVELFGEFARFE